MNTKLRKEAINELEKDWKNHGKCEKSQGY